MLAPCSCHSPLVTHMDLKVASDAKIDLRSTRIRNTPAVGRLESLPPSAMSNHTHHTPRDKARRDTHPPIQVENFRSGGAEMRIFTSRGASFRTSFRSRSP
jgi:hypothetical protein